MVSLLTPTDVDLSVHVHSGRGLAERLPRLVEYTTRGDQVPLTRHPGWLNVLAQAFGHTPYALEAVEGGRTVGYLPLAFVHSFLFGRFLVSLPYLNSNGVQADHAGAARSLVDRAVTLADELKVRHLELRHEGSLEHPALNGAMSEKVHMRLALPDFPGPLWEAVGSKARNQVRKGEKCGLTASWGGMELLPEFYDVFSKNMRDLGTPVYGQRLFRAILTAYVKEAELCVLRLGKLPVAAALLLHGRGMTEVPSASSLRDYNSTCANMLLYWNLLERAVERGQQVFDFGRSTIDGSTYRFKKQWGALPEPAIWQYYLRNGSAGELRPDNPKYRRLVRIWQKLPVRLTRWIGPKIVRGIP
jgi:FemAB-related protein (PEP-CTERM system-associated)